MARIKTDKEALQSEIRLMLFKYEEIFRQAEHPSKFFGAKGKRTYVDYIKYILKVGNVITLNELRLDMIGKLQ